MKRNLLTVILVLLCSADRGLDARDMPQVRAIVRNAKRDNYKLSTLILGVARSTPFRMSTAVEVSIR